MIIDYAGCNKFVFEQDEDEINYSSMEEPLIEFEQIKKYILYQQLKEIKQRLSSIPSNGNISSLNSISQFVDLLIVFYNSLSYIELSRLINSLLDRLNENIKGEPIE